MLTDPRIIQFIQKLRIDHYRLGKEKIKPILDEYCFSIGINPPSVSTIGKIISRLGLFYSKPNHRIYHQAGNHYRLASKRIRVKKAKSSYGLIQLDTIERIDHGIRQYFYSAIDTRSKFALILNYPRKNSENTVDFIKKFRDVYPLTIKTIQTDNGSEFLGNFNNYIKSVGLNHVFIYPRCPKVNGCVERLNRTVQEEFIDPNLSFLIDDTFQFNRLLADYNIWYNYQRVHKSLDLKTPLQHLVEKQLMSKMYGTRT